MRANIRSVILSRSASGTSRSPQGSSRRGKGSDRECSALIRDVTRAVRLGNDSIVPIPPRTASLLSLPRKLRRRPSRYLAEGGRERRHAGVAELRGELLHRDAGVRGQAPDRGGDAGALA